MRRHLALGTVILILATPATAADAPAHGVFVSAGVSTCTEFAADGRQDCAFESFTVVAPPDVTQRTCAATLPATLTLTTSAFGTRTIYLHGELHVANGVGVFYGATDPAWQQGVVANGELVYTGAICASTTVATRLVGSYDVITMIPI